MKLYVSVFRPSGVALVRAEDEGAQAALRSRRFRVTADALDFAREVLRMRARGSRRGHVVLVPHGVRSDFAFSARLAAALVGAYMATPNDYLSKGVSCGCHFQSSFDRKGPRLTVAVSAGMARDFPTASQLLNAVAEAGGSRIVVARSPRKLEKLFKRATEVRKLQNHRVLATQQDRNATKEMYKPLYVGCDDLVRWFQLPVSGVACPGFC